MKRDQQKAIHAKGGLVGKWKLQTKKGFTTKSMVVKPQGNNTYSVYRNCEGRRHCLMSESFDKEQVERFINDGNGRKVQRVKNSQIRWSDKNKISKWRKEEDRGRRIGRIGNTYKR